MATGIVRFYNAAKGFGLITPDLGGPAIFAQGSQVKGGKKLAASQRVEFEVVEGPTGACASNIRTL